MADVLDDTVLTEDTDDFETFGVSVEFLLGPTVRKSY
jgi:hypothetical protein